MKTKTLILAIATLCLLPLLIGCAYRSGPNLSSPAYLSASPENKDRIARGNIGIGMTIDECRAAWPQERFEFISDYQTGENRYETWRVENYSRQATPSVPRQVSGKFG